MFFSLRLSALSEGCDYDIKKISQVSDDSVLLLTDIGL